MRLQTATAALFLALGFNACADHHAKDGEKKAEEKTATAEKWIPLFNGKDLDGWTPKIRFEKFGEDKRNTFRVEDGLLKVRYDNYESFNVEPGKKKELFGHLFYKAPYSHYKLRMEYRFVGKQLKDGPGWARRNSGAMLHGQTGESMTVDQDFPNSIEVQLLGGFDGKPRTTLNLCTPGTQVIYKEKLDKRHCISSTSKTYHGEEWVTVEIEVRGSEVIRHFDTDGKVVHEYMAPQTDDGTLLEGGTISLQSESHPCDFRKVEILPLD